MDWKILIVIVVGLLIFGLFQLCSGNEKVDWDKARIEQIDEKQKQQDVKEGEEKRKEKDVALEKAREIQGERPSEQTASLKTDDFRAVFSSRGGALRSFELLDRQYMEIPMNWKSGVRGEDTAKVVPVNMVTTNPDYELNSPLRFEIYEGLDGMLSETDYEIVAKTANTITFRYAQPDQPVVILKKFELAKEESGPFQIWLTTQVTNVGDETLSFMAGVTQTGYQHQSEAGGGMFSRQPNLLSGLCKHGQDLYREPWNSDDAIKKFSGLNAIFAGVETNYFLSAMIPGDDSPTTCRAYADVKRDGEGTPLYGITRVQLRWGETEIKPGESRVFKVKNYLGPKRYQLLQTIGCDLEESVDYGWFAPISRVLLWLLFAFQHMVINWGVAIILLTLVVKLVLLPLTHKSFKSSDRMKSLKPEVDKINEKYKDDAQEKQKQTMALYKQHKVNPLGGCLPMLLQMPIWFALFRTLRASPELYRAEFFGWIHDLSSPDPYYITPIVMGGMMFVQQLFMPMAGDNAQAKMLKYFMPIMFTAMMLFLPSGLTLYILVNTVLSILHQLVIQRMRAKAAKG